MSVTEFDLFVQEIAWTYSRNNLQALRVKFRGMLNKGHLSMGLYKGLNREIRSREDWLMNRGRK